MSKEQWEVVEISGTVRNRGDSRTRAILQYCFDNQDARYAAQWLNSGRDTSPGTGFVVRRVESTKAEKPNDDVWEVVANMGRVCGKGASRTDAIWAYNAKTFQTDEYIQEWIDSGKARSPNGTRWVRKIKKLIWCVWLHKGNDAYPVHETDIRGTGKTRTEALLACRDHRGCSTFDRITFGGKLASIIDTDNTVIDDRPVTYIVKQIEMPNWAKEE
jgi:hypothetical protein